MRKTLPSVLLLAAPALVAAEAAPSERWDVTSKVVELTVPGMPGFLARMAKGKSRAEHKCVAPGASTATLLAPDPKAQCRIERQQVADGRYSQVLSCPQKRGTPIHVSRTGTYDASGFAGRAEMTGQTPKGAMHIVLDQRAARVGGACGG